MCHKHNARKRHYFGPTLRGHADTRCQEAREKALLQYTKIHVLSYDSSSPVRSHTLDGKENRGLYTAGL